MPIAPAIFISSTYFDLWQVRADIGKLVRELGYGDLRSELDTFPINPDLRTVDNCRRIVEREADIFVLVIGGRYGYVEEDAGKSVTNLEYLTAKAKGIPTYVFVQKDILALAPTYAANPTADFSATVQNTKVFDFIEQVRDKDSVWAFGFDDADQITTALKAQLAALFKDSLGYRKTISTADQGWLKSLSPKAFRLAVEQPKAWEYRLFSQVLADNVNALSELREEYRFGLAYGPGDRVSIADLSSWATSKINELSLSISTLDTLFNKVLPEALGELGESGNARKINFVSTRIADVYRQCLEWSKTIRQATFQEGGKRAQKAMARFPEKAIESIERFGEESLKRIEEGLSLASPENPIVQELVLKLDFHEGDYEEALQDWQDWAQENPDA